eukprot:COSAG02_NODE_65095_length_259_cov_0.531250_1_plen_62_part_01
MASLFTTECSNWTFLLCQEGLLMTIMGVFQHPQLSRMRSFVLCKLDPQLCLRISGLLHGFFQ